MKGQKAHEVNLSRRNDSHHCRGSPSGKFDESVKIEKILY